MASRKKQEVVEAKSEAQLPAGYDMGELEADAQDSPTMTMDDVALPYISILQANSPQVNPGLPEYIEGVQASMLFNNVSGEVFDGKNEGIMVVPCGYERKLVEWIHRDHGGGWVRDHELESNILSHTSPDDQGRPRLPNGNVIVETAYQYCLMLNPHSDAWEQCVIALKSTGLKRNRRWNNMIVTSKIPGTDSQAPRFLFPYNLRTEIETKGENSWFSYKIAKHEEPVDIQVYKAARDFAELVKSGAIRRSTELEPEAESSPKPELDDEIPF